MSLLRHRYVVRAFAALGTAAVLFLLFIFLVRPAALRAIAYATNRERHLELWVASRIAPTVFGGQHLLVSSGMSMGSVKRSIEHPDVSISIQKHPQNKAGEIIKSVSQSQQSAKRFQKLSYKEKWVAYNAPPLNTLRKVTRGLMIVFSALLLILIFRFTPVKGVFKLGFAAAMLSLTFRKIKPSESHGSAAWMTPKEMARQLPKEPGSQLVLGRLGKTWVRIPERYQYTHPLVIAPTGYGKTVTEVVPNVARESGQRTIVITDPKREVMRLTSGYLREKFTDRVWVLDFLDPSISQGYNPLAYIHNMVDATLFAQTWVTNTGVAKSGDPIWENTNRQITASAALHLVKTWERERRGLPPFSALAQFLAGQSPDKVRQQLLRSPVPEVGMRARGTMASMEKVEKLLGSVWTELASRFECLDDPRIRAVTSKNEIDIESLGSSPAALYIPIYLEKQEILKPITACFFMSFFSVLMERATHEGGTLPTKVMCYLDEFGVLGAIPDFAGRMATMRSYGIGCFLIAQTLAQIRKQYGREEGDAIIANATIKVALPGMELRDAEYFSDLAGDTTVITESQVGQRQTMSVFQNSGNRSRAETKRSLIRPDELMRMDNKVFVVYRNRKPILADQVPYFDTPQIIDRVWNGSGADPLDSLHRPQPLQDPGFVVEDTRSAKDGAQREGSPHDEDDAQPVPAPEPSLQAEGIQRLTEKHLAVLRLMGSKLSSKQIAQRLGYGEQTVRNYSTTIYSCLGVQVRGERGRQQAYTRALQRGILTPNKPKVRTSEIAPDGTLRKVDLKEEQGRE